MAQVARKSDLLLVKMNVAQAVRLGPLVSGEHFAGEDIDSGAPCFIKESDGNVYMSNGTAANDDARVHGFAPTSSLQGEPVDLYPPFIRWGYAPTGTLASGQTVYLDTTKGRLSNTPTTGDPNGIGFSPDGQDIIFTQLKLEGG